MVSPDKPMGQLLAISSLVFEAQSLTNSSRSLGIVFKFPHGRSLGQSYFPLGLGPSGNSDYPWDLLRGNFSRQPLCTVCTRLVAP